MTSLPLTASRQSGPRTGPHAPVGAARAGTNSCEEHTHTGTTGHVPTPKPTI